MKMKKRKGASSILILYTVVILVVLGLFTVVSASLNYKQSVSQSIWNKNYYELDSYAESVVAEIDDALFTAEQKAVKYIMTNEYMFNNSITIPQEVHNINKKLYNGDINNTYDVLNNTYMYLAINNLSPITEKYGGTVVPIYNEDGSVFSLYYKNVFSDENDPKYKLNVQININDILYDVVVTGNTFNSSKIDFKSRYTIYNWSQSYE